MDTAVNGLGHIDDVWGAWPNIIRSPLYWSNAAQVEPMRIYAEFTASLLGKGSIGEGSEEWRARIWAWRSEDRVGKSWGFPRGWQGERSRVKSSIVDSRRHSGRTDNRLRVCSAVGKTLAGRILALRLNRDAGRWRECSWSTEGRGRTLRQTSEPNPMCDSLACGGNLPLLYRWQHYTNYCTQLSWHALLSNHETIYTNSNMNTKF